MLKDGGFPYFHPDPSMSTLCKQQCGTEKDNLSCDLPSAPGAPQLPQFIVGQMDRPTGLNSMKKTPPVHPIGFICCPVQAEQNYFSFSISLACRAWAEIPASSPGHMEPAAAAFSWRCLDETKIFVEKKRCCKPLMCSH